MPVGNQCRFCTAEVLSFTTVNVINSSVVNNLQKLLTELFCKQNTRSNNNNGGRTNLIKLLLSIVDHTQSLATTRGDDDLTLVVLLHRFQCFLLVGAKGDQVVSCSVWIYYSRKGSPKEPPVPLEELFYSHRFSKGIVIL